MKITKIPASKFKSKRLRLLTADDRIREWGKVPIV